MLLRNEIINYPLANSKELEISASAPEGDINNHWRDIFHRRIIQHNIRVVAMYYNRIRLTRLGELLGLDAVLLEKEISSMVSDGTLYAKIDRPADVAKFERKKNSEEILTSWAADIDKLLHLVETTAHLIHKEKVAPQ